MAVSIKKHLTLVTAISIIDAYTRVGFLFIKYSDSQNSVLQYFAQAPSYTQVTPIAVKSEYFQPLDSRSAGKDIGRRRNIFLNALACTSRYGVDPVRRKFINCSQSDDNKAQPGLLLSLREC